MNARNYLISLGIDLLPPGRSTIGRLAITGEFVLNGARGVVIRPKRGLISQRYIELLASENIAWVVSDSDNTFFIYGANQGRSLEPIPALPIASPTLFPTPDVFRLFADRFHRAWGPKGSQLILGSKLFAARIADEMQNKLEKPDWETSDLATKYNQQALRSAMALLSGYRLTPTNRLETAILLDGLAQLADPRNLQVGLPSSLFFAFDGTWSSGHDVTVISAALGCQFIPLLGVMTGSAILCGHVQEAGDLLHVLFPSTPFIYTDFLAWFPKASPDRLIIVPPVRPILSISPSPSDLKKNIFSKKPAKSTPVEILYIRHAIEIAAPGAVVMVVVPEGFLSSVGHSEFRSWLLERVRLLAVMSLPAGSCFAGTTMRCSLLYLQKISPIPSDYPIFMMDVDSNDLLKAERRLELQEPLDNFLEKEMRQCG